MLPSQNGPPIINKTAEVIRTPFLNALLCTFLKILSLFLFPILICSFHYKRGCVFAAPSFHASILPSLLFFLCRDRDPQFL